jgi:hypothetical protein
MPLTACFSARSECILGGNLRGRAVNAWGKRMTAALRRLLNAPLAGQRWLC